MLAVLSECTPQKAAAPEKIRPCSACLQVRTGFVLSWCRYTLPRTAGMRGFVSQPGALILPLPQNANIWNGLSSRTASSGAKGELPLPCPRARFWVRRCFWAGHRPCVGTVSCPLASGWCWGPSATVVAAEGLMSPNPACWADAGNCLGSALPRPQPHRPLCVVSAKSHRLLLTWQWKCVLKHHRLSALPKSETQRVECCTQAQPRLSTSPCLDMDFTQVNIWMCSFLLKSLNGEAHPRSTLPRAPGS